MRKKAILLEIKEILMNDFELTRDIVQQINSWDGALDFLEWYENDEEFFDMYFQGNVVDALQKAYYGNYNFNEPYVKFNNLENFESGYEYDVLDDYKDYIDEIIEALIETRDNIYITSGSILDDLINEYEEIEYNKLMKGLITNTY